MAPNNRIGSLCVRNRPNPGFIHLRVHSAYSLLEGALHISALAALCQRHHLPALGITDTGNLFGCLEFSEAWSKAGIQPIIGCTLSVDFQDDETEAENGRGGRSGTSPNTGAPGERMQVRLRQSSAPVEQRLSGHRQLA